MSEKEDISLIATKNIDAFERIFKLYQPKLVSFLKGFLHGEEMSEDMAQDIFLHLWENCDKLVNVSNFSTYLFQIAKYKVYNYFDHLLVRERYTIEQVISINHADSVEEDIFLKDLQEYIAKIVNEMPPQRQRIFKMSRYDGMNNDEIACQLGINKRTVENHLSAALSDLRKVLRVCILFF